jgi:uncharacterized protein (TIRG00374 family)
MPPGESDPDQERPDAAPVSVQGLSESRPLEPEPENGEQEEPSFFEDPGQITKTLVIVVVLVAAIYVVLPKIAGLDDAVAKLGEARRSWVLLAVIAMGLSFASYVAVFRSVISESTVKLDWRESYQITMAGLAATRLFSAGGAGGIVLTYWALRKAGMRTQETAQRMFAFLVLLYSVYVLAVIVFGVLLRIGVLPGDGPVSMTIVPAAIAAIVALTILLIALIPGDLERRMDRRTGDGRLGALMTRLAALPATMAEGIRTSWRFVAESRLGWLGILGAVGFWASNILILWASFRSLGITVPLGEIVVGFFVGMAANLAPAPAGVGAVDGGLIGAFAIFGYPLETVIAAVLIYRLIAFYFPVPPGIVAFFQLRGTVARWEQERVEAAGAEPGPTSRPASPISTS